MLSVDQPPSHEFLDDTTSSHDVSSSEDASNGTHRSTHDPALTAARRAWLPREDGSFLCAPVRTTVGPTHFYAAPTSSYTETSSSSSGDLDLYFFPGAEESDLTGTSVTATAATTTLTRRTSANPASETDSEAVEAAASDDGGGAPSSVEEVSSTSRVTLTFGGRDSSQDAVLHDSSRISSVLEESSISRVERDGDRSTASPSSSLDVIRNHLALLNGDEDINEEGIHGNDEEGIHGNDEEERRENINGDDVVDRGNGVDIDHVVDGGNGVDIVLDDVVDRGNGVGIVLDDVVDRWRAEDAINGDDVVDRWRAEDAEEETSLSLRDSRPRPGRDRESDSNARRKRNIVCGVSRERVCGRVDAEGLGQGSSSRPPHKIARKRARVCGGRERKIAVWE